MFSMRIAFLAAILFVLSMCLLIWQSCLMDSGNYVLCFVVPNGYRGVFVIKLDEADGEPSPPLINGVREVRVPPSGVVIFQDIGFFAEWHTTVARYYDGTTLPTEENDSLNDDSHPGEKVRVLDMGAFFAPMNEMYVLVGTESERKQLRMFELPDQLEKMQKQIESRSRMDHWPE